MLDTTKKHSMENLRQRLERGENILLNGATGTELEKRGVPMDDAAWCATALATHPDVVREVHVSPQDVSLISIMHTQTEDTVPASQEVKEHWDGPVEAYPHMESSSCPTGSL